MLRMTHLAGFGSGRIRLVTWNPADKGAGVTLSNENMTAAMASTNPMVRATRSFTSGKVQWEVKVEAVGSFSPVIGVAKATAGLASFLGSDANGWGYYGNNGNKLNNAGSVAYGATFFAGDIITVQLDLDAGTLGFKKNDVSQGTAYTGLTGTFYPAVSSSTGDSSEIVTARFWLPEFAYSLTAGYIAAE